MNVKQFTMKWINFSAIQCVWEDDFRRVTQRGRERETFYAQCFVLQIDYWTWAFEFICAICSNKSCFGKKNHCNNANKRPQWYSIWKNPKNFEQTSGGILGQSCYCTHQYNFSVGGGRWRVVQNHQRLHECVPFTIVSIIYWNSKPILNSIHCWFEPFVRLIRS